MRAVQQISRRRWLAASTVSGGFTFLPSRVLGRGGAIPPSERLNLAFIGVGGRGSLNLRELSGQNVVALCDVDWRQPDPVEKRPDAIRAPSQFPTAKRYDDYRIMLQEMEKNIDAVVVSTADHTHAVASIAAMKMRKHVYCEKPLAHTIAEVEAVMAAARKYKVSTQTGNQGHSSEDIRMIVEWIRDGAIGTVKEVHVGVSGRNREADFARIKEDHPLPPELKWDLWLGPAAYRPFHPMYLPGHWRSWLPFGTGGIGDFNCHLLDPAFWALDLGLPETIEAETNPGYDVRQNDQTYPSTAMVRYQFPARGKRAPVTVTWHSGKELPRAEFLKPGEPLPVQGGIIVGVKGAIVFGKMFHGKAGNATPGMVTLHPEELDKSYKRPAKTIPRTNGHWNDWVESCKAGKPAGSHFSYGGVLTEIALLGNIAIRRKGQILRWEAKKMRFTNDTEANRLISPPPFREGWSL